MSHGGGGGDKCDPNLTPLLDLVLQLLMFFMMCVNFVSEQVNEDIILPVAQSAMPMDKREVDYLFLNVDAKGRVLIPGREPMTMPEAKFWLRQQYDDAARASKDGTVKTAVIIRAHRDADYAQVFQVFRLCKDEKFRTLKLRAITQGGEG